MGSKASVFKELLLYSPTLPSHQSFVSLKSKSQWSSLAKKFVATSLLPTLFYKRVRSIRKRLDKCQFFSTPLKLPQSTSLPKFEQPDFFAFMVLMAPPTLQATQ